MMSRPEKRERNVCMYENMTKICKPTKISLSCLVSQNLNEPNVKNKASGFMDFLVEKNLHYYLFFIDHCAALSWGIEHQKTKILLKECHAKIARCLLLSLVGYNKMFPVNY